MPSFLPPSKHPGTRESLAWELAAASQSLSGFAHQESCLTCFEGCIVRHIAHNLLSIDQIQAVADGCTLPEAVGPLHGAVLQLSKPAIDNRQHPLQLWLHAHNLRERLVQTIVSDHDGPVAIGCQQHANGPMLQARWTLLILVLTTVQLQHEAA